MSRVDPAATSATNVRMALGLLFLVSCFNYMDRYMLAVLLPAIKRDLLLSDTQIGFITGLAFTLFYATLGIPIARLADRYSRRNIIAAALAVWSAMTAVCGLAQNFFQLALARVMVGVGEAGASPPSHSLIADFFPAELRARALSVFTLGAPVGILIALAGFLYLILIGDKNIRQLSQQELPDFKSILLRCVNAVLLLALLIP